MMFANDGARAGPASPSAGGRAIAACPAAARVKYESDVYPSVVRRGIARVDVGRFDLVDGDRLSRARTFFCSLRRPMVGFGKTSPGDDPGALLVFQHCWRMAESFLRSAFVEDAVARWRGGLVDHFPSQSPPAPKSVARRRGDRAKSAVIRSLLKYPCAPRESALGW